MKDSHFKSVSDLSHLTHFQNTPSGDVGDPVMHIGKLVCMRFVEALRGTTATATRKKTFSCLDQYLRMTFAQLTHRESLRTILKFARAPRRTSCTTGGIRGNVSRSAVADANEHRDWRI